MPTRPATYAERLRQQRQGQAGSVRVPDPRPSACQRGYDGPWQRTREAWVATHPLCEDCLAEGITTPVAEVDHVIPLDEGGAKHDPANLRSLCHKHHRRKTLRDKRRGGQIISRMHAS